MWKNAELWTAIITFILSGISLPKIVEWVKSLNESWKRNKLLKKVKAGYEDTVSMYEDVFTPIRNQTNAERVLLLRCHDSGNLTSPLVQWFATVVLESYNENVPSVKADFREVNLDVAYIKMLVDALKDMRSGVKMIVNELPEGSLLKQIYEGHGIVAAQVFIINVKEGEVYYLSITSTKATFFSDKEQLLICNKVHLARELTKKY